MNVWVEDGELLFYVSRSGTFDEHNTLLKQGRVRVTLDDPSLVGEGFRQTLCLHDGYNEVRMKGVTLCLWADVSRPVVHLELAGEKPFTYTVAYENWRYAAPSVKAKDSSVPTNGPCRRMLSPRVIRSQHVAMRSCSFTVTRLARCLTMSLRSKAWTV